MTTNVDGIQISLVWTIFTFFLTIWTLISNFVVILVFVMNRKLHTPSNLLVSHLAVTDFLLALMVLPLSSVYDSLGYWPFNLATCTYWLIADVVLCTASIWSLVFIAIDRYIATSYPFWYRKGVSIAYKRFLPYFFIIWTISLFLSVPQMLVQKTNNSNGQCNLFDELHYVYYSALASFVMPFVIMLLVYMRILCLIRINNTKTQLPSLSIKSQDPSKGQIVIPTTTTTTEATSSESPTNSDGTRMVNSALKNTCNFVFMFLGGNKIDSARISKREIASDTSSSSCLVNKSQMTTARSDSHPAINLSDYEHRRLTIYNQNINQRRETNSFLSILQSQRFQTRENLATKRMATLVGLYIVCWMPFTVFYLRDDLGGTEDGQRSTFTKCIFWLGYANSGLNPFFYTILNGEFRYHLLRLLRSSLCLPCNHRNPSSSDNINNNNIDCTEIVIKKDDNSSYYPKCSKRGDDEP